jgi:regulatory protein
MKVLAHSEGFEEETPRMSGPDDSLDSTKAGNLALSYCLKAVKTRLRSSRELEQALLRKGIEASIITGVLAELQGVGLVDDERYARAWIHTRDLLQPRGASLLQAELTKKGIPKEVIKAALLERKEQAADQESDQPTEDDLAKEVVRRKERQYAHLQPEVRERRLLALLMRRGFSYDVARRILGA